jgi:hypothetical protein
MPVPTPPGYFPLRVEYWNQALAIANGAPDIDKPGFYVTFQATSGVQPLYKHVRIPYTPAAYTEYGIALALQKNELSGEAKAFAEGVLNGAITEGGTTPPPGGGTTPPPGGGITPPPGGGTRPQECPPGYYRNEKGECVKPLPVSKSFGDWLQKPILIDGQPLDIGGIYINNGHVVLAVAAAGLLMWWSSR